MSSTGKYLEWLAKPVRLTGYKLRIHKYISNVCSILLISLFTLQITRSSIYIIELTRLCYL